MLTERRDDPAVEDVLLRYRISPGEHLDAVGLVKRAGFEPDQFAPIVNIAAAPWLAEARKRVGSDLDRLGEACRDLRLGRIRSTIPVAQPFPHDASVFYPHRWVSLFKELQKNKRAFGGRNDAARAWGEQHVMPILKKLAPHIGAPCQYVACLVADGDKMGETLDRLLKGDRSDAERHREFSEALGKFPGRVRDIVESERHLGSLVYAGADDVLAFLPVATAAHCAQALATAFEDAMRGAEHLDVVPTLSVGIGIGHFMEAMGDLLDLGRKAEKMAKEAGPRNALAIIVDKRSGGQRSWAAGWGSNPVAQLEEDVRLLSGPLATGKIYEIGALLRRLPAGLKGAPDGMLEAYATGILAQSQRDRSDRVHLAQLERSTSLAKGHSASHKKRHRELNAVIDRLLIAKALKEGGFASTAASSHQEPG